MLLRKNRKDPVFDEDEDLAYEFWTEMTTHIPEWQQIADGDVVAATLQRKLSSHSRRRAQSHGHCEC